MDGLNGRYAVLALFTLMFFVMFGIADVSALLHPVATTEANRGPLSEPEAVVLIGGLMTVGAYFGIVKLLARKARTAAPRDWPRQAALWVGLPSWLVCTYMTYYWYVYIATDTAADVMKKALQTHDAYTISAFMLAQTFQPLGLLLLTYLWRISKVRALGAMVLLAVLVQVFIGFVADIKGLAMIGGILIIASIVLIEGRLPKSWLAAAAVYLIVVFPLFQTYRSEIHGARGMARSEVIANFGKVLALTLERNEFINEGRDRAQTFLERSSLLENVSIIVEHTGVDTPFLHGYTLSPLLAAFVPRVIWSDKKEIPVGQIMNHTFHIYDSDVYISPSHLGELYWNFGWAGVIGGMGTIGLILGFVGARFNTREACTLTRLLITAVTIKQLIMYFEGEIATNYVVWLRSIVGIGLLHVVFARVPVPWQSSSSRAAGDAGVQPVNAPIVRFPNLLT
jgi:hypothetical protein